MGKLNNRALLTGNVGQDPEIINLDSGGKIAKFSLATNDVYTNSQGEKVTKTEWHNVIAWNKLAEIIENYVEKGSRLSIDGQIQYKNYENSEGKKVYYTEIQANEILMLGK